MGQVLFMESADRAHVVSACPWAQYVAETSCGFAAFEFLDDFLSWLRVRNWAESNARA